MILGHWLLPVLGLGLELHQPLFLVSSSLTCLANLRSCCLCNALYLYLYLYLCFYLFVSLSLSLFLVVSLSLSLHVYLYLSIPIFCFSGESCHYRKYVQVAINIRNVREADIKKKKKDGSQIKKKEIEGAK